MRTTRAKRDEQAQIVKKFGKRMRVARELCGLSQEKAAARFGYLNSSKLNKIEFASDTNSVPLWLVLKASEVYQVSIDFLFGISDEWERDPIVSQQRQVHKWLVERHEKAKDAEANAVHVLHGQQVSIAKAINQILARSKENLNHVEQVRMKNPEFDDLKGGAKLLRLLAETAEDAMGISYELQKIRSNMKVEHEG
ncbi:MAG: helix-turn-helix domain-containing protein [Methylobacter sp.]